MRTLLAGQWVERAKSFPVRDPQNGALIDTVPRACRDDALAAIAFAHEWRESRQLPPTHERMRVLREAAEHVAARHEELARTIASEGVKTIREARKEATDMGPLISEEAVCRVEALVDDARAIASTRCHLAAARDRDWGARACASPSRK